MHRDIEGIVIQIQIYIYRFIIVLTNEADLSKPQKEGSFSAFDLFIIIIIIFVLWIQAKTKKVRSTTRTLSLEEI
jgi:hypothetical protein